MRLLPLVEFLSPLVGLNHGNDDLLLDVTEFVEGAGSHLGEAGKPLLLHPRLQLLSGCLRISCCVTETKQGVTSKKTTR